MLWEKNVALMRNGSIQWTLLDRIWKRLLCWTQTCTCTLLVCVAVKLVCRMKKKSLQKALLPKHLRQNASLKWSFLIITPSEKQHTCQPSLWACARARAHNMNPAFNKWPPPPPADERTTRLSVTFNDPLWLPQISESACHPFPIRESLLGPAAGHDRWHTSMVWLKWDLNRWPFGLGDQALGSWQQSPLSDGSRAGRRGTEQRGRSV